MLSLDEVSEIQFAFCDTSPWDFKKAEKNAISKDLVSYISYLLYPYAPDTSVIKDQDQLEKEYAEVLAKYENDTIKVLDAVTRDVESYIFYCSFCKAKAPSSFFTHRYIKQRKCFLSPSNFTSTIPLLYSKLGLILSLRSPEKDQPRLTNGIASTKARFSNVIDVIIYDSSNTIEISKETDFYPVIWNHTNVIPVNVNKQDWTNSARFVEVKQCNEDPFYTKERCKTRSSFVVACLERI